MTKQTIKEKSEQKLLEIFLEMWIKGDSKLSRTVEVSHNPDEKILKLDSRTLQFPRFSHLGDPHGQNSGRQGWLQAAGPSWATWVEFCRPVRLANLELQ